MAISVVFARRSAITQFASGRIVWAPNAAGTVASSQRAELTLVDDALAGRGSADLRCSVSPSASVRNQGYGSPSELSSSSDRPLAAGLDCTQSWARSASLGSL